MPYDYEREVRTANSEAYLIMDGDNAVGRIDTHYLPGVAHIAIAVEQSVTPAQIEEIISDIDADMPEHRRLGAGCAYVPCVPGYGNPGVQRHRLR